MPISLIKFRTPDDRFLLLTRRGHCAIIVDLVVTADFKIHVIEPSSGAMQKILTSIREKTLELAVMQGRVLVLILALLTQSTAVSAHMSMAVGSMTSERTNEMTEQVQASSDSPGSEMPDCHTKTSKDVAAAVTAKLSGCCDGDCTMAGCQPQGAVTTPIASIDFGQHPPHYHATVITPPTKRSSFLFRPPVLG